MNGTNDQIEAAANDASQGREQALVRLLDDPEAVRSCEHEYPQMHRIRDFATAAGGIRLCRCVTCGQRLFLIRVETSDVSSAGVPMELRGEALRRWVSKEEASPSKAPVDWGIWLESDGVKT